MAEFIASNGIPVELYSNGRLQVMNSDHTYPETVAVGSHVDALREFFQHERDEELERWRWPENPDVLVYRDGPEERRSVTLVFEATGGVVIGMSERFLAGTPDEGYESRRAARAYFAAHPEPKPWLDAQVGDIWVLTMHGRQRIVRGFVPAFDPRPVVFLPVDVHGETWFTLESPGITDGRRIWPEVSE